MPRHSPYTLISLVIKIEENIQCVLVVILLINYPYAIFKELGLVPLGTNQNLFHNREMVEVNGIEPMTFAVQMRRSPI